MTHKGSVGLVDDTPTGHYFDVTPAATSSPRTVSLVLPDLTIDLTSDRGVFSGGQIDPGTRLLLLEAPRPDSAADTLLDLGCGYGAIATALAMRAPHATVWAVDVNERALELTRANATRLGLGNVRASTPDAVPADVRFDGIWSNPPVRIGKHRLHGMLVRWIARLGPGAHAYLVVQKNLGADSLQRWLVEQGSPTTRLRSRAGYRLLDVTRGPDPA
jgi:16S rRNA (guanine1207-N2)-methyltransferase